MTTDESYENPADVNIIDEKPALIAGNGNRISFASKDGIDYIVDIDPRDISPGELPLTVFGDGRPYGINIKNDAKLGNYELYITKATSINDDVKQYEEKADVMMFRQNPPRMIIRVE